MKEMEKEDLRSLTRQQFDQSQNRKNKLNKCRNDFAAEVDFRKRLEEEINGLLKNYEELTSKYGELTDQLS